MSYKKIQALTAILLLTFFYSCSKQEQPVVKKNTDTVSRNIPVKKDTVVVKDNDSLFDNITVTGVKKSADASTDVQKKLDDIFDKYLEIKNELADNDSVDTRKQAAEMLDGIAKASTDLEKDVSAKWKLDEAKFMKYQKAINDATTLKEQREWFNKLTVTLTEVIQKYGLPGKTIYELSGKNGKWLVDSKDSEDPYTGDDEDNSTGNVKVVRAWDFE